jgi:hypothetical protein
MRYIRQKPYGKFEVRLWIAQLGYQVSFGTFPTFDEAKHARDRAEAKLSINDPCPRYKPVKPRKPSKSQKELYKSRI